MDPQVATELYFDDLASQREQDGLNPDAIYIFQGMGKKDGNYRGVGCGPKERESDLLNQAFEVSRAPLGRGVIVGTLEDIRDGDGRIIQDLSGPVYEPVLA